jgi:ADP-heptose:LPS heptosyltransferase
MRRPAVESFVRRFFKPTLLPYPAKGALPTDIEANRLVASELLQREVSANEILPTLRPPREVAPKNRWLLCPFSSTNSKDYPAESWAEALKHLTPERGGAALHLAAGPTQFDRLQNFARTLEAAGLKNIAIDPPVPLPDFLQSTAEARLVLTVDTAAAHMTCALGTPALILSAGQHPGVYAPYSKNCRQTWLIPPTGLPKGEWRKYFTPEKIADSARRILSADGENF